MSMDLKTKDLKTNEVRVWDPAVRGFHWLLVGGFFTAYLTEEDWMSWHIWAGYLVSALLAFRLVWGFVGPRTARFSDFVYSPKTVLRYLSDVWRLRAKRHLGHNPAGGAMIVALLCTVTLTVVSGMALYGADAWLGPLAGIMKGSSDEAIDLWKEIHDIAANVSVLLVIVHVAGVVWESILHRENLVKSMFHGNKRAPEPPKSTG